MLCRHSSGTQGDFMGLFFWLIAVVAATRWNPSRCESSNLPWFLKVFYPTFPGVLHVHRNSIVLLLGFCLVLFCFCFVTAVEAHPPVLQNLSTRSKKLCLRGVRIYGVFFLYLLHECSWSLAFLSQVWWVNMSQRSKFSFQSLFMSPKGPL